MDATGSHFNRTAYFDSFGEIIRTPRLIAQHYLHGMFLLDLISSIPMDNIMDAVLAGDSHEHFFWLGVLRLPRMVIVVRCVRAHHPVPSSLACLRGRRCVRCTDDRTCVCSIRVDCKTYGDFSCRRDFSILGSVLNRPLKRSP